jgi:hypothetical protein
MASCTRASPGQPFYRIRASSANVSNCSTHPAARLALFHFDFWRGSEPSLRRARTAPSRVRTVCPRPLLTPRTCKLSRSRGIVTTRSRPP